MKTTKRVLVLMVALIMLITALEIPGFAAELQSTSSNDVTVVRASGQVSGLPFTMTPGVNITTLWQTNRSSGGYNFVPGNISSGSTVTISGTFNHTVSTGVCKSGICIFSNGVAKAVSYTTRRKGYPFSNTSTGSASALCSLSALDADTTYYGFIKNNTQNTAGTYYIYDANITIGIR